MSLRWRLAVILGAIAFAAISLSSAAAYLSTTRELDAAAHRLLNERIALIQRTVGSDLADLRAGRGRDSVRDLRRLEAEAQVVLRDGRVVVLGNVEFPVGDRVATVVNGLTRAYEYNVQLSEGRYLVRVQSTPVGVAMVGVDRTADDAVLTGLRNRQLFVGALAVSFAAGVGWVIARQITQPIERLTAATGRVATTNDLTPVPVEGDAEVGTLAASFNAMLAALASSKDQQRRLVEDASHELRTPLTSVRTNIDVLRTAATLTPEDHAAILDDLNLEVTELTELVGELVDLARDPDLDEEPKTPVRIDELVSEICARAARRSGRSIETAVSPATLVARRTSLERAISNLVSNAIKFSPEGSAIEVAQTGGSLRVRDHGPGVADSDKQRVFERFYRSDATRSAPGSGLGLSIVAATVADLGGTTVLGDAPGGGAIVGFDVPTATA